MNFKIYLFILGLLNLTSSIFAQNQNFMTSPNGLKYKILKSEANSRKIQMDDLIDFQLTVQNYKDSLIGSQTYKSVSVTPPINKIDVREIFGLLSQGDSALCVVSVDSVVKLSGEEPPKFFPKGTSVKYFFKILAVKSRTEIQATESKVLSEYAQKNNLKVQTTASGLQYTMLIQGAGRRPNQGETVRVNYTGKLLNGKVFDTSLDYVAQANNLFNPNRPYQPLGFALGQGQVIKGWDEGISLLTLGSKAILLIPSYLAYGERGAGGDIPPNSPLVFEVELVGIE
jgi:FKBP-type peptidyl-prolyl cis-trans isomerase FkpA